MPRRPVDGNYVSCLGSLIVGHDISAYLGPDDQNLQTEWLATELQGPQVAYLRRGAHNSLRHQIYEVLDAQDCDGDVSGAPGTRWVTREKLESALKELERRRDDGIAVNEEIRFVRECLGALPAHRSSIYVYFG
jgi:hypothetical protein